MRFKIMNKYFVKRGNRNITVDFNGEELDLVVSVPTNREHNQLMEKYTKFTMEGTADIKMAEMAEAQMLNYIIELPFEVPVDEEMNIFKSWSECNNNEKKIAINCMDSKLHDAISTSIMTTNGLTEEESGN
jgi:hypothetical protein